MAPLRKARHLGRRVAMPNNRMERRVNDKVPSSSLGARGAHAEG